MFRLWLGLVLGCYCSRRRLLNENLALRQQLSVLKRRHPRPKLTAADRLFWLLARRPLVLLEGSTHFGQPGDRCAVAPGWVPLVLEHALEGAKGAR
jgi:hypothetical protein